MLVDNHPCGETTTFVCTNSQRCQHCQRHRGDNAGILFMLPSLPFIIEHVLTGASSSRSRALLELQKLHITHHASVIPQNIRLRVKITILAAEVSMRLWQPQPLHVCFHFHDVLVGTSFARFHVVDAWHSLPINSTSDWWSRKTKNPLHISYWTRRCHHPHQSHTGGVQITSVGFQLVAIHLEVCLTWSSPLWYRRVATARDLRFHVLYVKGTRGNVKSWNHTLENSNKSNKPTNTIE